MLKQFYPWRLTVRALGWLIAFSPGRGEFGWGDIRAITVIIFAVWGWLAGSEYQINSTDFAIKYPPQESLTVESGEITVPKCRKCSADFLFKSSDGTIHILQRNHAGFVKVSWFRDENSNLVWHQAQVSWFEQPSGRKWLASLRLEGMLLSDYEDRRNTFYTFKDNNLTTDISSFWGITNLIAIYSFHLLATLTVLAYIIAWNQLREGERVQANDVGSCSVKTTDMPNKLNLPKKCKMFGGYVFVTRHSLFTVIAPFLFVNSFALLMLLVMRATGSTVGFFFVLVVMIAYSALHIKLFAFPVSTSINLTTGVATMKSIFPYVWSKVITINDAESDLKVSHYDMKGGRYITLCLMTGGFNENIIWESGKKDAKENAETLKKFLVDAISSNCA